MYALRQGAEPVPLAASVGLGLALRFLVPAPAGITLQAWTLLSIFVSAIAGAIPAAFAAAPAPPEVLRGVRSMIVTVFAVVAQGHRAALSAGRGVVLSLVVAGIRDLEG